MNYYEVLGVDSKAGADDIKRAYRKKAKEFAGEGGFGLNGKATEDWIGVNEAWETLQDAEKRKAYDASLLEQTAAPAPEAAVSGRMTVNAMFTRPEQEAADLFQGIFRRYLNYSAEDEKEQLGVSGDSWRISYWINQQGREKELGRRYEIKTNNGWQDIDEVTAPLFSDLRIWRDLMETAVVRSAYMEHARFGGDWASVVEALNNLAVFQRKEGYILARNVMDTWLNDRTEGTIRVAKWPLIRFNLRENDNLEHSQTIFEQQRQFIPGVPENPWLRIRFGDEEPKETQQIRWGKEINWGEGSGTLR